MHNNASLALSVIIMIVAGYGVVAASAWPWKAALFPLVIGIGMIPRGEVGLIFANLGLGLVLHGERIVDQRLYSAVVIMVVLSTLVTPPALKWAFARRRAPRHKPFAYRMPGSIPFMPRIIFCRLPPLSFFIIVRICSY